MYTIKQFRDVKASELIEFILPTLTDLEGIVFELFFTHGGRSKYQLKKQYIHWLDPLSYKPRRAKYRATSLRSGIYLIDYMFERKSFSIILDLHNQIFTKVTSLLPNHFNKNLIESAPPTIDFSITRGSLDKPYIQDQLLHHQTDELIGSSYIFRYGVDRVYEHTYIDKEHYTWHCLAGNDVGTIDTNSCRYYKIANQLYLLIWVDKTLPSLGLMLLDLEILRGDGKICGYLPELAGLTNLPIGPYCSPSIQLSESA